MQTLMCLQSSYMYCAAVTSYNNPPKVLFFFCGGGGGGGVLECAPLISFQEIDFF